jgi:hypothetical protein
MGGPAQEITWPRSHEAPAAREEAPETGKGPSAGATNKSGRISIGIPKLNMAAYEPNLDLIIESVLPKGTHVDPHTGQLVVPTAAAAPAHTAAQGMER